MLLLLAALSLCLPEKRLSTLIRVQLIFHVYDSLYARVALVPCVISCSHRNFDLSRYCCGRVAAPETIRAVITSCTHSIDRMEREPTAHFHLLRTIASMPIVFVFVCVCDNDKMLEMCLAFANKFSVNCVSHAP